MPEPGAEPVAGTEAGLSPPERTLLRALQQGEGPLDEPTLAARTGLPSDTVRGSLQRLRSKRLALVAETHLEEWRTSPRGRELGRTGFPERRLWRVLREAGPLEPEAARARGGLSEEEQSIAIGVLRRLGWLAPGTPLVPSGSAPEAGTERFPDEESLASVAEGRPLERPALERLRRRGLVAAERRTERAWRASEEGARYPLTEAGEPELGALTPTLLRTGEWRTGRFRPYEVRGAVPYRVGPEPHPYFRFLEEFAELLVGLGFEEAEGPLLETEFWNNDVLFMPQEHPARSVHDLFSARLGSPGPDAEPALLERVAAAHEGRPLPGEDLPLSRGWQAPYSREVAARAVLRSQTTAVSARYLARGPAAPFRMFCLDRNFRPDALDATHLIEFAQCEGVLGEPDITLRDLVGIFQELAEGIGIRELKFRPSYYPFTEPSVDGYIRHPRLGWMEVFPGGMLRPEVRRPLGITVPVAAWGIGVTRLATVALHVNDIRELYTDDLGRLAGGE